LRLDPFSLPVLFEAHDYRADDRIRHIELHRERVILRRDVDGMRMAINVSVKQFLGVACHDLGEDQQMIVLEHRDPMLSIPLCVSSDPGAIDAAWMLWSATLALPRLMEDGDRFEPAPRRRRRHPLGARRPKFLTRRQVGDLDQTSRIHREDEIIAPD
jgi:hypothetical protein